MRTALFVFISILFLFPGKTTCNAQDNEDSLSILFVGNSYTYFGNLPHMISIISEKTSTKLNTRMSTIGGARLSEHWNSERNLKTKEMIKDGNFDIVVLQEFSMGSINQPDSMLKYSDLFCDYIKENGARPYFYLTWAREKVPQYQEVINKVYDQVSAKNEAIMVPAGKAWELARKLRPGIELFTPDGSHPSSLGAFLTACVFIAVLTGELPDELDTYYSIPDINGDPIELMVLDPLDVVFCKKVAEEIVLE